MERRLIFRTHAVRRMFERRITEADVRAVLKNGRVIRAYDDDTPYPSRLVLASIDGRVLHVVCADVLDSHDTIVITVYEPDPTQWNPSFDEKV
jgi:hypothetical protein